MFQRKIQLETEYNPDLGRTVFFDKITSTILFEATEACSEFCDSIELAIALVLRIDDPIILIIEPDNDDQTAFDDDGSDNQDTYGDDTPDRDDLNPLGF